MAVRSCRSLEKEKKYKKLEIAGWAMFVAGLLIMIFSDFLRLLGVGLLIIGFFMLKYVKGRQE